MASRVLAVDDEPTIRRLLEVTLSLRGYEVRTAADGREALAMIRADAPDLIVLDVRMPEVSGFEVLEALKADPALRNLPVVMLTALGEEEDVLRGIRGGVAGYLTKPFDPIQLLNLVARTLARGRRGGDADDGPDTGDTGD